MGGEEDGGKLQKNQEKSRKNECVFPEKMKNPGNFAKNREKSRKKCGKMQKMGKMKLYFSTNSC